MNPVPKPGASILDVGGLSVELQLPSGPVRVVEDVSFTIHAAETVAIVGESGCGKSLTALALMRLLPSVAKICGGAIRFGGSEITALSERQMTRLRGRKMSMIFQDPVGALNPVIPVGVQVAEGLSHQGGLSRQQARDRAIDLLREVNIPDPESRYGEFPHRLSGGMCQRIGIAMAIGHRPQLLIADEPTTALDVTIQAQILSLLTRLQRGTGMAMLFITHDLGVVAETAHRVLVMYAGRIVEEASVDNVFDAPLHPYTRGLLASTLGPGRPPGRLERGRLERGRIAEIPGKVPAIDKRPSGCAFADRCASVVSRCREQRPILVEVTQGRRVSCWIAQAEAKAGGHAYAL
jgi:peptide/nickel transport system ATP-binding protein